MVMLSTPSKRKSFIWALKHLQRLKNFFEDNNNFFQVFFNHLTFRLFQICQVFYIHLNFIIF